MDWTKIFEAGILLLAAIAEAFLIPWLKGKVEAEKLACLMDTVRIAVQAAEQIYGCNHGQQKKEYVLKYLTDRGIVFDAATIENTIESAVLEMNNQLLA